MHKYLMVGLLGLAQSSLAGDQSPVAAELVAVNLDLAEELVSGLDVPVTLVSEDDLRLADAGLVSSSPRKLRPGLSKFKPQDSSSGSLARMLQARLSAAHNQKALDAKMLGKLVVGSRE